MFSEKLNFMIDLIGAKNSELARATNMDASHISRLRNGSRRLPKKQTYVLLMASYFARHITDPFKKKVMADVLHYHGEWPVNPDTAAEIIGKWLVTEDTADSSNISAFLAGFAGAGKARLPISAMPVSDRSNTNQSELCYYGNEGKRAAVIRFLTEVLNETTAQTLLLHSDEEMSWLYDDKVFSAQWAQLLTAVLRKGNRIKIIHTVSRDSGEMIEALAKWVPVYMTGAIEPYYYPRLRDGVFQKTLFLAPRTAAVVSSSVKMNTTDMVNLYIVVPEALTALSAEFDRYLALCRPLMNIMTAARAEHYFSEAADFESIHAPTMMLSSLPSLMTMPESLVQHFAKRVPQIHSAWEKSKATAFVISEENEYYEIIVPPAAEQIESDTIPFPVSDFLNAESLHYTISDYKEHLKGVLRLARDNPSYHVVVSDKAIRDIMLYVKDDVGVILTKATTPAVAFTFREPNMTAAFWDYMQNAAAVSCTAKSKAGIKELEELIKRL